jgi:FkbM family methyltransferase
MIERAAAVYRWTAGRSADALACVPALERPFVSAGSRLSNLPGVGRFYRSVAYRFADRLRRDGTPYRTVMLEGARLTVDITEFTTFGLYFTGRRYEPRTTDYLTGSLGPGDTFVDIGANHGYFTLVAASRVGASGRVYAFEPNPPVFRQLAAHVRLNRFADRVLLADTALSDVNGTAALFVSQCVLNSGLSSLQTPAGHAGGALSPECAVPVRTETFDCWYERVKPGRIAVMKIDVEGAEDRVFEGMTATLRSGAIGAIVCETEWNGGVRDRLAACGYTARLLEPSAGLPNLVFERR